MLIELTTCDKDGNNEMKELLSIDKLRGVAPRDNGAKVYLAGAYVYVKESPAQIQEMILLDEFAKAALTGLCSNCEYLASLNLAKEAYRIADIMIEARKEALK